MRMDGGGKVVEGVAALLAASLDHGQHGFHKATAARTLCTEGELPPDHGVTQGAFPRIVGRLNTLETANYVTSRRCDCRANHPTYLTITF